MVVPLVPLVPTYNEKKTEWNIDISWSRTRGREHATDAHDASKWSARLFATLIQKLISTFTRM